MDIPSACRWRTMTQAGQRVGRGKRFMRAQAKAGKLRAARIGDRGEYLTTDEWIDEYVESEIVPVMVQPRRRRA